MTEPVRGRIARLISFYDAPEPVAGDGHGEMDVQRIAEMVKNHVPVRRDGVWTRCRCGLWAGFDQWANHVAAEISGA